MEPHTVIAVEVSEFDLSFVQEAISLQQGSCYLQLMVHVGL